MRRITEQSATPRNVGLHVFLKPIEHAGEDDGLARLAPDYFSDA